MYYFIELKMSSKQKRENMWVLILYELFILHFQLFKKDIKSFLLDSVITARFFRFIDRELNLEYKYNTVIVSVILYTIQYSLISTLY